ncbi:MAG: hypothetical protein UX43_C0001G0095 [Candidatus Giovannonibacteria bacterium GW2011_GWB1_46_20]|uniref:DUF218 domain-containing protein n=1 Tax=Candidatus Giovannonibacteria bacterium GW2011_GWA1_44_25 TaxID=1618645 RepID=A0A0G1IMT6_9BACT|nr:MAG: hypothetical protein UW15_C0011G0053 [Parcubacteria group bacterium GW2011_GWC1_44_10]KKT60465.1 MAG: hypothetical protein UW53_C0001G0115 [Candidatus Giovannonibacteria bacterium GW2011_GWA1_44_25]KKU30323.1 MAG: hypothetical protein UX43_C0001G0095 [Candidatus Giovannonibacteria bacterium GW2011_GWB1_46_20]
MKRYDVVVPFPCGLPTELTSNIKIITRAVKRGSELNIPIFADGDLPAVSYQGCILSEKVSGRSTTLKLIKLRLVPEAKKNRWKNILVVAESHHATRCVRDLKKLGFCAEADNWQENLCDLASEAWWTRRLEFLLPREIILRLLPWRIYEWLAMK